MGPDDLSYQAAVVEGALSILTKYVASVDVRDLFSVIEALNRFSDAIKSSRSS